MNRPEVVGGPKPCLKGGDFAPWSMLEWWRARAETVRSAARPTLLVVQTHAVQVHRRPSPQVFQGAIPGDELAGIRCRAGSTGKPDGVVVRPVKAGMFSRGQTCRGRSQSPVVWIAEEMETEPSKPIDKTSPGEVTSHRAVTKVNALWPRKAVFPRAEPTTIGRRQNEQPKTDRYGCSPWRGGSDSTVTRTC